MKLSSINDNILLINTEVFWLRWCICLLFIDIIGYVIDDELTVKPGTPLNMEISLDQKSKDIYGLLVSNMRVTDTRDQEENLIING